MERAKAKKKKRTKRKEDGKNAAVDKVFGNLDLLTKILNLLPHKPLVRSKAVSKYWLASISDPHFLLDYSRLLYTTHPPSSFSQFYHDTVQISLDGSVFPRMDYIGGDPLYYIFTNHKRYIISCSCNGLILSQYNREQCLVVFNPTTQKHRKLPWGCHISSGNTVLAFDPLISLNYKVVDFKYLSFDETHSLESDISFKECEIDIFSSESDSWKRICLPAPEVGVCISTMVFWNGGIHWITIANFHIRFDVNEENFTWNHIPTDPNTFPEGADTGYMGVCDTGLLFIKFSQNGNYSLTSGQVCTLTVMEMKKGSDCWVPKHHVNLEKLLNIMGLSGTRDRFTTYNVLHVISESDKDYFSLVVWVKGKIILYSIHNRNNHISSKVLGDFRYPTLHKFFPFIPCLAPV